MMTFKELAIKNGFLESDFPDLAERAGSIKLLNDRVDAFPEMMGGVFLAGLTVALMAKNRESALEGEL